MLARIQGKMRALFASLLAVAMLLSAGPAFADARTEARAHFKKGMDAIGQGRYEEGIVELQKAYEILPHPNVLYNMARAYAEAGELATVAIHDRAQPVGCAGGELQERRVERDAGMLDRGLHADRNQSSRVAARCLHQTRTGCAKRPRHEAR